MSTQKIEQWEKEFDKQFGFGFNNVRIITGVPTCQHPSQDKIKDFIRNLLQSKESEYKREIVDEIDKTIKMTTEINKDRYEKFKFITEKYVKKLKQQHRKELEGLKMARVNIIPALISYDEVKIMNIVIDEINEKLDKLLNSKKEEM